MSLPRNWRENKSPRLLRVVVRPPRAGTAVMHGERKPRLRPG